MCWLRRVERVAQSPFSLQASEGLGKGTWVVVGCVLWGANQCPAWLVLGPPPAPPPITVGTCHRPTRNYPFYRHRDCPHLWGMSLNI